MHVLTVVLKVMSEEAVSLLKYPLVKEGTVNDRNAVAGVTRKLVTPEAIYFSSLYSTFFIFSTTCSVLYLSKSVPGYFMNRIIGVCTMMLDIDLDSRFVAR